MSLVRTRYLLMQCNKYVTSKFQISWIKVRTQTILTMDARVITRNPRISVVEREGDLWQLTIKDLKPSDQGWYMCQINTDPMVSERGFLEVTGLRTHTKKSKSKINTDNIF